MLKTDKYHVYIGLSCFILSIIISTLATKKQLIIIDNTIIAWLNKISLPIVVNTMELVTKVGSGEVIIGITLIIIILLLINKNFKFLLLFLILTCGGIFINFVLKITFQRERPGEMSYIDVFGYSFEIASYSFPSGHTMRIVILFSFLIYLSYHLIKSQLLRTTVTVICSTIIIMVALSRIIVGAHFPSDIIAAITMAITWFYLCIISMNSILRKKESIG